ncbi:MAG: lipopolysaccharide biosynthesis protein [Porticoccaceae bacterium]
MYGLRLGVQVALLLLLARWLGPAHYGEFAGVAALAMGLATLSGFGLNFVVLMESAKSADAGAEVLERAVPATLLSATLLLPLYLWLAVVVIGSTAGLASLSLIGLSELLLVPLLGLLSNRLHGLGYVARSQALALWPLALRLAGLVGCMTLAPTGNLDIYALVHALGALAALVLGGALAAARAQLPQSLHWPERAALRHGARFAVMNLAAMSPGELDKALALRLLGASGTGLYALASRGMAVVTLPVVAMLLAALPRLIRGLHQSDTAHRRLLRVVLSLSALYGVSAAVLLHWAAPSLLEWLLGAAYVGIGAVVAKIAWIAPFMSLRIATGATLFALNRPMLRSAIEGGAVVLLTTLALTLTPHFGLDGLVWAVLLSEAVMALFGVVALATHLRGPSPLPASMPHIGPG